MNLQPTPPGQPAPLGNPDTPAEGTPPVAYQRSADLDSTMFYMGSLQSFLVTGADTRGRLAMTVFQTKPGNEPPPHYHAWENEIFYVLEGNISVTIEGEDTVFTAGPGETIFIPVNKAHSFTVLSPQLRMLILVQAVDDRSVGLDRYFMAMASPATSMSLPDHAVTYEMDDPAHSIRVGAEHGVIILSPEEISQRLPHYHGFAVDPK